MIRGGSALLLAALAATAPARAQSTLDAPENLSGAWVATPGVLQFNFLHRFSMGPAPARKVVNAPSFTMALGVAERFTVGGTYVSSSDIVEAFPNEWELFARVAPLVQQHGAPFDLFLHGAYNAAARSGDAQVLVARRLGRLRLVEAAQVLSNAFDSGRTRVAWGGGATLRLTSGLALAADYASLLSADPGEDAAWSAGLQLRIPYSPHTLSLHASNVNGRTLQGIARGSGVTRYGFEFTIPLTLRRYFGGGPRRPAPGAAPPPDDLRAPVVTIDIRQIRYAHERIEVSVGTTVEWRNRDPLAHTVTADSAGAFESGEIAPDRTWRHAFTQPGTYAYHCTPHPFMKGVVVVR